MLTAFARLGVRNGQIRENVFAILPLIGLGSLLQALFAGEYVVRPLNGVERVIIHRQNC